MIKKIFEEKTDKKYVMVAPTFNVNLPFADLIRGIPKHKENSKKYYRSAFSDMIFSMMLSYGVLLVLLSLCLKNFYLNTLIPIILLVSISQINNKRRMKYFKDEVYNIVCKKYYRNKSY